MAEASRDARAELHRLVKEAAEELRALGPEPILIAGAPNKFNDAWEDDYWFAVQIGDRFWEQSQFFRGRSTAFAQEKSYLAMAAGSPDVGTSVMEARDIIEGRKILARLQSLGWRSLAEQVLKKEPIKEPILALVLQYDQEWLQLSDPMGNWTTCYLITPDDFVLFATEDARVDEKVGFPNLIRPSRFNSSSLAFLSDAARAQFLPEMADSAAAKDLLARLRDAESKLRSLTDHNVMMAVGAPTHGHSRYVFHGHHDHGADWPRIQVNGVVFKRNSIQEILQYPTMREDIRAERLARFDFADFPAILAVAEELNELPVRRCFERALGVDTYDREGLYLIFSGASPLIIHRTSVFVVHDDGIALAGFLNEEPALAANQDLIDQIVRLDAEVVRAFGPPEGGSVIH